MIVTTHRTCKLFVNLPVRDLTRSVDFFTRLGFGFDPKFTDDQATCMLLGEDAYVMLLVEKRFRDFARKPIGDATTVTGGILAITAGSRAEVDELADVALAGGGSRAADPMDLGFMYLRSFYDPDGHHWEVFWMDPASLQR
jgi:predicted lactoylglutathione lyase